MQASPVSYPPARRVDTVDDLHGHRIPDPYRWLEEPTSSEAVAWSEAQGRMCRAVVDSLPGRDHLRRRYRELLSVGYMSGPHWLGHPERYFFMRRLGGEEHGKLLVHEPDGEDRVLIDPMALDPSGTTTLDGYSPSWETDLLAYQLSEGGDEESSLYVRELASGRQVEGPTLHRVGSDPDQDEEVFGDRHGRGWYFGTSLSRPDGRWLVGGGAGDRGRARSHPATGRAQVDIDLGAVGSPQKDPQVAAARASLCTNTAAAARPPVSWTPASDLETGPIIGHRFGRVSRLRLSLVRRWPLTT